MATASQRRSCIVMGKSKNSEKCEKCGNGLVGKTQVAVGT